jgi:hypothetical protein
MSLWLPFGPGEDASLIPEATVENLVRAFCFFGRETDVHFRLRPVLPDPATNSFST